MTDKQGYIDKVDIINTKLNGVFCDALHKFQFLAKL